MKWRRSFAAPAGGRSRDNDWTLYTDDGRNVARIYLIEHGPQEGRWFWSVHVDQQGRWFNGGTGREETGCEAKEACEARIRASALVDGRVA